MADYQFVTPAGVIIPDTAELRADVESEWKEAFGQDLVTTPETPQGVMITMEVEARDAVARNNADLANQINPDLAGGIFLDAICALSGLERDAATRSVISGASLSGVPNTLIPAGSQASTDDGDLFETISAVVLSVSGVATVDFQSVEFGPIPAGVGALNNIATGVLGWETVSNPNAAVLGSNQQSDASLRAKRRLTLALQGVSLVEAIVSALHDVPGVKSLQFRENIANTTQIIDGISLIAHSVWACVDGGTDADIGAALLENKSNGAGWNGAVTVNVPEPASGQVYAVKFDRPTLVPTLVRATVKQFQAVGDPQVIVRDAVLAYYNNTIEGEQGMIVGQDVSPFEIAGAINRQAPAFYVQKLEVALQSTGIYQTTEIDIATDAKATTTSGNITVIVV